MRHVTLGPTTSTSVSAKSSDVPGPWRASRWVIAGPWCAATVTTSAVQRRDPCFLRHTTNSTPTWFDTVFESYTLVVKTPDHPYETRHLYLPGSSRCSPARRRPPASRRPRPPARAPRRRARRAPTRGEGITVTVRLQYGCSTITVRLQYTTLHYITLHDMTLHCIALHCIALHCIASHCIALHYSRRRWVTGDR